MGWLYELINRFRALTSRSREHKQNVNNGLAGASKQSSPTKGDEVAETALVFQPGPGRSEHQPPTDRRPATRQRTQPRLAHNLARLKSTCSEAFAKAMGRLVCHALCQQPSIPLPLRLCGGLYQAALGSQELPP